MKKKSSTLIRVSRFMILALTIILQAVALWVINFRLSQKFLWLQLFMSIIGVLLFFTIINKDQPAVYKMPWAILFAVFPIVGVMVYYTFGNVNLSKKHIRELNSVFSETESESVLSNSTLNALKKENPYAYGQAKYISSACSLTVSNDSYIKFLPSGEEFFKTLKEELLKAEKYVFFEYFIIEDGVMWSEIHEILKNKAKNGVKVYLMYDDVGCMPRLNKNYCKTLCDEGIIAVKFNPFRPIVSVIHNNRDHRKITVIDGKTGLTGGINIADEYINVTKPFGRWKDTGVIVKGSATDSLVKTFCQLYNMASKTKIDVKDFIERTHENYSNYGYVVPYTDGPAPIFLEHIAEKAYLNVINQATDYLYITTPYLVVDTDILDALKNAAQRGVDVKLILPEIPDKKIVNIMTKSNYYRLISHGVKIYEYKNGFIHSKTFVSDGIGIVGTVNLDYRSLVHHFECAVWTYNSPCVEDMRCDFVNMIENETIEISKEKAKQPLFHRIIKNIVNIFAPLL